MSDALTRLLRTDDWDAVAWGLELAQAKGAGDALLEGIQVEDIGGYRQESPSFRAHEDKPNTAIALTERWSHRPGRRMVRELAVIGLISTAEGPNADALRQGIEELVIAAQDHVGVPSLDLGVLSGLGGLKRLRVQHPSLQNLAALGVLPLETLWLSNEGGQVATVEGLPKTLKKLVLQGQFEGLASLRELPALRELVLVTKRPVDVGVLPRSLHRLHFDEVQVVNGDATGGLKELRNLAFQRCSGALRTSGWSLEHLETVEVNNGKHGSLQYGPSMDLALTEPLSLPSLKTLSFEGNLVVNHVPTLPALAKARLVSSHELDLSGLASQPALADLSLVGASSRLGPGERFAALQKLHMARAVHIEDLGALSALQDLVIHTRGESLAAISHLSLRSVQVRGGVVDLDEVPRAQRAGFGELRLQGVRSLKGISRWGAITALKLERCPDLTSLDGLQGLHELEYLGLQQCPNIADAAALDGLPALRAVVTWGGGPKKTLFPKSIRAAVSTAKSPNIAALKARPAPCAPAEPEPEPVVVVVNAASRALQAVLASPHEDGPRRDFATEDAEHRALIDNQLAGPSTDYRADYERHREQAKLVREHGMRILKSLALGPVPDLPLARYRSLPVAFHRGFPEQLTLDAAFWLEHSAQLRASLPFVRRLSLDKLEGEQLTRLESAPWQGLDAIIIEGGAARGMEKEFGQFFATLRCPEFSFSLTAYEKLYRALLASPMPWLKRLGAHDGLNANGAKALHAADLPELTHLDLAGRGGEPTIPKFLAGAPGMPKLRSLSLARLRVAAAGLKHLAGSGLVGRLASLNLDNTNGGQGVKVVAEACEPGMRALQLAWTKLNKPTVQCLAGAEGLSGLRLLNLERCQLTDKTAAELAKSKVLAEDLVLVVSGNELESSLPALQERFGLVLHEEKADKNLAMRLVRRDWASA